MWLQYLEVVVLVVTGGYVAYQTHRHFSLARSEYYIERFNSGEMRELRKRADIWVGGDQPFERIFREADELDEASSLNLEALRLLSSFFQELGTAYKHRTVNRTYVWDVFGRLILKYGRELSPFICESREYHQRPTLYIDFERMAQDMEKTDRHRVSRSRKSTWFRDNRPSQRA